MQARPPKIFLDTSRGAGYKYNGLTVQSIKGACVAPSTGKAVGALPSLATEVAKGARVVASTGQAPLRPTPANMNHGVLLAALRNQQKELGHLSEEFITETARSLDMSVSDVYGVATFYSFLSCRRPMGRNTIRVCGNIPCYLKGSDMIVKGIRKEIGIGPGETTADGRFSLELTNCIGACDVAPAMLVNDDIHGELTPEKLQGVLKDYH
jgi:NADH-quinone oxidoreductase E subunit